MCKFKKTMAVIMSVLALTNATGISGGAMNFDGVDDYIEKSISDFDSSSYQGTINMWVKPSETSGGNREFFASADEGTWDNFFIFYVEEITGKVSLATRVNSGTQDIIKGNTKITDGEWHQVTLVSDGTRYFIYLDGDGESLSVTSGSNSGNWFGDIQDRDNIDIGVLHASDSILNCFNGQIDEVLVYNRALPAKEIKAIYTDENAWYPKDGLVSRWSMENNGINTGQSHPNGSTIKDSAGSNDGTINDGGDGSMTLTSSPTRKKRGRR